MAKQEVSEIDLRNEQHDLLINLPDSCRPPLPREYLCFIDLENDNRYVVSGCHVPQYLSQGRSVYGNFVPEGILLNCLIQQSLFAFFNVRKFLTASGIFLLVALVTYFGTWKETSHSC